MLVDGALMNTERHLHRVACENSGGAVRYVMADASSQHRREFEHVLIREIQREVLVELMFASDELIGLWSAGQNNTTQPSTPIGPNDDPPWGQRL